MVAISGIIITIESMRTKHKKTLDLIFQDPIRSDVRWIDIESLLRELGAEIIERKGSRVSFHLRGKVAVFHRPHPQNETDKGSRKSVRRLLRGVGIEP